MKRTLQGLVLAAGLLLPTLALQPYAAYANGPSVPLSPPAGGFSAANTVSHVQGADPSGNGPFAPPAGGFTGSSADSNVLGADFAVTIAGANALVVGQTEDVTLQITNRRGTPRDVVNALMELETNPLMVEELVQAPSGFACNVTGMGGVGPSQIVICNNGTVAAGASVSITVRYRAVSPGDAVLRTSTWANVSAAETPFALDQVTIHVSDS